MEKKFSDISIKERMASDLDRQERQPLKADSGLLDEEAGLNPPDVNKDGAQWSMKHTMGVLVVRLFIDFLFKNPFLFYANYSSSLGISNAEFGYILIFSEVGAIIAIVVNSNDYIRRFSTGTIFTTFSIIGGVASILFTMPSYTPIDTAIGIVLFCGICRFFVGLSFAFLSAETIRFVSILNCGEPQNKKKITGTGRTKKKKEIKKRRNEKTRPKKLETKKKKKKLQNKQKRN